MKPRVSILNPAFVWIPACATNVAKTFEKYRAQQAAQKPAAKTSVVNMKRPKV